MSFPDPKSTIEAQPLIAVRNVRASSRWYVELLGADSIPEHPHRDVYDRISHSGRLLLQLHAWDAEGHPNLVNADAAPPGHGVLLWFQIDDFDSVVERVRGLGAKIAPAVKLVTSKTRQVPRIAPMSLLSSKESMSDQAPAFRAKREGHIERRARRANALTQDQNSAQKSSVRSRTRGLRRDNGLPARWQPV